VNRYTRQITLPEIGEAGQRKLREGSVLVVGAGGLGSPVAIYLAAAGVGRIGLVDFDRVDVTNLHRQVLYGTSAVGQPKLQAAKERLQDLNDEVRIETREARLTSENALEIMATYDVIVDGTDNFATRYLVNDACVLLGKPNVYGSIFRFEGQAAVFATKDGPCYRCLYPDPPPPGLVPSCAEGGVLGVLPGVVGTIQATEAIKLITGAGETLAGRLLMFDALRMTFRTLKVPRRCEQHATITHLIDYEEFCNPMHSTDITPAEVAEKLAQGSDVVLIDVREPYEWQAGHVDQIGRAHV
jgi:molybdopterin/thiamine biosynthesis adenylyltransferase